MASEQMSRRENTTTERDVHVEKNRVPKMTTHFEHLAEQVKEGSDTPQGSIQELQGGEYRKQHGGRAIGDIGGTGKTRETHELGPHFESLADKVKGDKQENKESYAAKARNNAPHSNVGKFEVKAGENKDSAGEARGRNQSELESRTRVVNTGRPTESAVQKQIRESRGQVEAEKGRRDSRGQVGAEKGRRESRGQVGAEVGRSLENRGEARIREESREEKLGRGTEGEVKGRVGVKTQGPTAVITCTIEGGEKEEIGRGARELEAARERAKLEENRGRGGDQEKESQSTLGDISKYRGQVQENTMEAMRAAQDRYERAKQAASETVGSTTQTAQEKAAKARETAMEKAAQAKDVTQDKAAQAAQMAAQAKDYTLEKAAQAKDVTLEKGQQGYAIAKDAISSATGTASDYTSQAAEKAKSAGSTTTQYIGEKAGQAKDVTVETGKTAAEYAGKVAADLKDKATVAGWTAAHYSTEMTVEGTKAAANIVQGTAGYAANVAGEIASKSLDAVKGLASKAGDTAKDYTARKKEEAKKDYVTKKASQPQEQGQQRGGGEGGMLQNISGTFQQGGGQTKEGGGIGETIGQYAQSTKETIGQYAQSTKETVGDIAQTMKKPLDTVAQGGGEVMEAVGETVGEIGQTMIKPAERASEQVPKGQAGSGVIDAIGETIAEIAQTTKTMVVGDNEIEAGSKQSIGSEFDRGNQGGFALEERRRETSEARKT
ncbi:seed biotin-containing protein SBP65-like [Neltuma alba]|uniref:seed biotin-containing protein SBP65-like n=1 Tax=Neltuma alba TaxID=207710 RepID=UPI0010A50AE2|nr:seed biotin-containing protein SBP65-like [Prosopis alba]